MNSYKIISFILFSFLAGLLTGYFYFKTEIDLSNRNINTKASTSPILSFQQSTADLSIDSSSNNSSVLENKNPSIHLIQAFEAKNPNFLGILAESSRAEILKAIKDAESSCPQSERSLLQAILVNRLGEIDGDAAVNIGLNELNSRGNAVLLMEAFCGWAKTSPNQALNSLGHLNLEPGLQEDVQRSIVSVWASRTPEAAASFALTNRDPNNPQGLTAVVADEWSKQNPTLAANWAAKLTPGIDKLWAINNIIGNWATANVEEVSKYICNQPIGESRDLMAGSLAQKIAKSDLASGLKWIEMVNNPQTQRVASLGILFEAYSKNPGYTTLVLKKSMLSASIKEDLLNLLANP